MSCHFVLPPPTLYLLLSDIYVEAHSWKVFLCRKDPLQLPFSANKMQVKRDFPLYVGVGGWMEGECVCGIDDRYIYSKTSLIRPSMI